MASCVSIALNGIAGHCETAKGGIKAVYVAEAADVTDVSVNSTNGVIETITMASGKKFKKYTFRKQSSNFNSEASIDDAIGSKYWTNNVEMVFVKADAAKRLEMNALLQDDCVAIVQDQMDNYIYMGYEDVVSVTAGTQETGTQFSDRNGYTITLTDQSSEPAHFVDATIISGIVDE